MGADVSAGLESGLYHVGREDGAVDPFPVRVHLFCTDGDPDCELCMDTAPRNNANLEHAVKHPGWWWRRVSVPNELPAQFAGDPMPSGMPDA